MIEGRLEFLLPLFILDFSASTTCKFYSGLAKHKIFWGFPLYRVVPPCERLGLMNRGVFLSVYLIYVCGNHNNWDENSTLSRIEVVKKFMSKKHLMFPPLNIYLILDGLLVKGTRRPSPHRNEKKNPKVRKKDSSDFFSSYSGS